MRAVSLFSAAAFPDYWFSTFFLWGLCHLPPSSLHWHLLSITPLQSLKMLASSSGSLTLSCAIFPGNTTPNRDEAPAPFIFLTSQLLPSACSVPLKQWVHSALTTTSTTFLAAFLSFDLHFLRPLFSLPAQISWNSLSSISTSWYTFKTQTTD